MSLSRNAAAPALMASKSWSSSSVAARATMPALGTSRLTRCVVSMPPGAGSDRSSSTMSGVYSAAASMALRESSASATTSKSASASRIWRMPTRKRAWSSTSRILTRRPGSRRSGPPRRRSGPVYSPGVIRRSSPWGEARAGASCPLASAMPASARSSRSCAARPHVLGCPIRSLPAGQRHGLHVARSIGAGDGASRHARSRRRAAVGEPEEPGRAAPAIAEGSGSAARHDARTWPRAALRDSVHARRRRRASGARTARPAPRPTAGPRQAGRWHRDPGRRPATSGGR